MIQGARSRKIKKKSNTNESCWFKISTQLADACGLPALFPGHFPQLTAQNLSKDSSTVGCLGFDGGEDKPSVSFSSIALLFTDLHTDPKPGTWGSVGSINSPHSRCLRHRPLPWSGNAAYTCPRWSSRACPPAQWGPSASAGHPGGCPGWLMAGCCWAGFCCHL